MKDGIHTRTNNFSASVSHRLFSGAVFIGMAFFLLLGTASSVPAFYQPEYQNRGITNFLDACVPKSGFMYQFFLNNFKSVDMRVRSHNAPGKFKLSVNITLQSLAYRSEKKFLGGYLGGELMIPYVNGYVTTDAGRSSDHGLGDIVAGGFIQSDFCHLKLGDYSFPFYWRVWTGLVLPTGDYDHDEAFNAGSNLTTFHSYFSSTIFLTEKWCASTRMNYNFHTKNDAYGPNRDDLKPGQLFTAIISTCYEVLPGVRLGTHGVIWRQTTDDKMNGHNLRGRETALSFGPGIVLSGNINGAQANLLLHGLFDTHVRNRPEGNLFQARLVVFF